MPHDVVTPPRRTRALRGPLTAVVSVVLLLALGLVVAGQLSGFLAISSTPVAAAPEQAEVAPVTEAVAAPRIEHLVVPDDVRSTLAADTLADAVAARGLARPAVETSAPAEDALRTLRVRLGTTLDSPSPEAYRVTSDDGGWVLDAPEVAGVAAGLYRLADRVRTSRELLPAELDGVVDAPRSATRIVDKGAAGVDDDPVAWTTGDPYSHNSGAFDDAVLADAPYVDADALAGDAQEFRDYVDHQLAEGFNGIVMPGFLEYVTFSGVGDGHAVYAEGDEHVARALAMRDAFGPLYEYAHDRGMKVYLGTDMLALSTPLEAYLDGQGLGPEDQGTWDVYASGLAELYAAMPGVDGLVIRIGEGGAIYDDPGWDYWSELAVTTPTAVRTMLTSLLAPTEDADRTLVFRTWSVGVGAVGDMHTNPGSYAAVLDGIDSPDLVVSTKHVAGDFYSWLPLNPTLDGGSQRRVVELQARREFEGFGSLPNDLGPAFGAALSHYLDANPQVEGVWTWTQDGGPWHAGPLSLYLRDGFWQLYDLNVYAASRLAWDPTEDTGAITADWARATFSDDPATVRAIGEAMALSRDAITHGLYIGAFAQNSTRALGLEPPPMMWIFEWDVLTGDSAALDSIYSVARDHVDDAVAEGYDAVTTAERMRDLVAGTDPTTWSDPALRDRFTDALDYEVDLLGTLATYRETVLRHAEWLDTGSSTAFAQWRTAREAYGTARAEHLARYADDVDLPAYTFTAADLGTARADRDTVMAWGARGLLALVVVALLVGAVPARRGPSFPGRAALGALWLGATRPWRLARRAPAATRTDRVLVWALPAVVLVGSRLVYTWFLAPAHLLMTLGAWLVVAVVLRLSIGRRDPWALWAALGGTALLRTVVLLVALAPHGPGGYWFGLWADPSARTLYVTVAFAGFAWVLVATAMALSAAYGLSVTGALGRVACAVGAVLVAGGLLVAAVGTEQALTTWNDQMALLPWGLSRILGITVHLGIPTDLPVLVAVAGAALALVGAALWWSAPWWSARRRRPVKA